MGTTAQHQRLLILDDDQDVATLFSEIARRHGFQTQLSVESAEFFLQLTQWQPSHLIIDLVMPGIDGIEVIKRLAGLCRDCNLIITSGLGTRVLEAAARTASEHGLHVSGILPKPFSPSTLRQLLDTPAPLKLTTDFAEPQSPYGHASERGLRIALEKDELVPWFQPKVSCGNGRVVGFESLARWFHPRHGLIMPDTFIPVAERFNLMGALTRSIVTRSLSWFGQHFHDTAMTLAVNIDASVLPDPRFPGWILAACEEHGVSPGQIILEITETTSMTDPSRSLELLTQFRIKGFNLSIDDFGAGYSSLVQLARFPFSEMKIEKVFMVSAQQSTESQKIAAAIIGLAKALGMRVTAEGVENQWALDFLRGLACDYAQGYYFSRALPGDDILHWMEQEALPRSRALTR